MTDADRLQAFFVHYGEALANGDLSGIAGCYEVPALVLGDAGSVAISSRSEIEAAFAGAAERHRARGMVAARPTIARSEAVTERLVFVDAAWDYLDERGRSAEQDGYRYVVRLDAAAGPQIRVVIPTAGR